MSAYDDDTRRFGGRLVGETLHSEWPTRVLASTEHPADDVMVRAAASDSVLSEDDVKSRLYDLYHWVPAVIDAGGVLRIHRIYESHEALRVIGSELARALDNRHGAAEGPSNQEHDNEQALLDRARKKGLLK